MEKRVSYFVSRKSLLVWLSALVMTASAVLRIAYSCGKGADAATVWFQIVLPVAACLIFVLMILLGGQERFYHTAIPAFLLAIYYSVRVSAVLTSLSLRFVFWVAYLAIAGFYAMTVSGRVRNNWALVLLLAAGIGVLAYTHRSAFSGANWSARVGFLPELLFLSLLLRLSPPVFPVSAPFPEVLLSPLLPEPRSAGLPALLLPAWKQLRFRPHCH